MTENLHRYLLVLNILYFILQVKNKNQYQRQIMWGKNRFLWKKVITQFFYMWP